MSTTTETRLDFRKLSARIGAEIRGLDLSGDLSDATIAQIREALNVHKALVFRDANIHDDDAQVRFASRFGPLTQAHPTVASVDGKPAVLPVDSENGSANTWHTDVTFVVNPPQASTLRSITLPAYGGETLIASAAGSLPGPARGTAEFRRHPVGHPHQRLRLLSAEKPGTRQRRRAPRGIHAAQVRNRPPGGPGPPPDRGTGPLHRRLRPTAAHRGPVQHRIQGHPAACCRPTSPGRRTWSG